MYTFRQKHNNKTSSHVLINLFIDIGTLLIIRGKPGSMHANNNPLPPYVIVR
jgi:hypothetical protein